MLVGSAESVAEQVKTKMIDRVIVNLSSHGYAPDLSQSSARPRGRCSSANGTPALLPLAEEAASFNGERQRRSGWSRAAA